MFNTASKTLILIFSPSFSKLGDGSYLGDQWHQLLKQQLLITSWFRFIFMVLFLEIQSSHFSWLKPQFPSILLFPPSSIPLPHTVALSQRVPLAHRRDDGDPVLRQFSELVDQLLHAGTGPGVTVEVISQDERALHQQLQLHQVTQPLEAQQVFLRLSTEKPAKQGRTYWGRTHFTVTTVTSSSDHSHQNFPQTAFLQGHSQNLLGTDQGCQTEGENLFRSFNLHGSC